MNKTLKLKILYVIAALAMLAMLIPAMAVPASAATGHLEMYLVDPLTNTTTTPDNGHNITGSVVYVVPVGMGAADTVTAWNVINYSNPSAGAVVETSALGTAGGAGAWAKVRGGYGEATIVASTSTGDLTIDKKWGQIYDTSITPPKSYPVTWNEESKKWEGTASVTDTVYGDFQNKDGQWVGANSPPYFPAYPSDSVPRPPMQGMILNWYIMDASCKVPLDCDLFENLIGPATLSGVDRQSGVIGGMKHRADFVHFGSPTLDMGTYIQTVSGPDGTSKVPIYATGEEAVKIVVIPQIPSTGLQVPVCPEVTTVNFWTREMEKVPQVRWAGEKIVLEKDFGPSYVGHVAIFSLENQSPGALEAINLTDLSFGSQQVETLIDNYGFARVILVCEDPGEVDVDLALHDFVYTNLDPIPPTLVPGPIINEHGFVVFYLKFESLTLGNVPGKRDGENCGLWTPPNPWDRTMEGGTSLDSKGPDTLNVSADALLRARVRGWFLNANPTNREQINVPNDPSGLLALPAHRWVLPDDWAALAGGGSAWKQTRIHWDIMDAPNDNVTTLPIADDGDLYTPSNPFGDYYKLIPNPPGSTPQTETYAIVGDFPLIGPFSPGIEIMTPDGWQIFPPVTLDPKQPFHTVVPNGKLDAWDAPMPPAKVIFDINDVSVMDENDMDIGDSGYFKGVRKTDVYYQWKYWDDSRIDLTGPPIATTEKDLGNPPDPENQYMVFTNPFYAEMIPAHYAIPAFINNGGYDWNSTDEAYGPYCFWNIINQPDTNAPVATTDPAGHPTKVEVYSDNHGEAMVWLNGNWNLDLSYWISKAGADVPFGTWVGSSTVQAMADYPYLRKHPVIISNTITKNWQWGGMILGPDAPNNGVAMVNTAGSNSPNSGDYITITSGSGPKDPLAWGKSTNHVVWLWVTDRDGGIKGVKDAKVVWKVSGANATLYSGGAISGINTAGPWSPLINIDAHGFLENTKGSVATPNVNNIVGTSYLRSPTLAEKHLFIKTYPTYTLADADNFVVAAIDVVSDPSGDVTVSETIYATDYGYWDYSAMPPKFYPVGSIDRVTNFTADTAYPLDDEILPGDANCDGVVNMLDITAVERYILGLNTVLTASSDANFNKVVDMGDVVRIEKTYLGLK